VIQTIAQSHAFEQGARAGNARGNVAAGKLVGQQNVFLSGRNLQRTYVMPYADVSTYHVLWSDVVLIESNALGYTLETVEEKPRTARPKSETKSRGAAKAEAKAERGAERKSAARKTSHKAVAKSAKPKAKAKTARKPAAKKSGKKKGK